MWVFLNPGDRNSPPSAPSAPADWCSCHCLGPVSFGLGDTTLYSTVHLLSPPLLGAEHRMGQMESPPFVASRLVEDRCFFSPFIHLFPRQVLRATHVHTRWGPRVQERPCSHEASLLVGNWIGH